jgi:hypothetical protein
MAECKFCHGGIEWRKVDGKSVPYNQDGTPHRCKSKPATNGTAPANTVIGRITEYEGSNVHVEHKVLFLAPEGRKVAQEKYPVGSVVRAAHDKGTCIGMEMATGADLEKFLSWERTQQTLASQPPAEAKKPAQVVDPHTDNGTHVHEPVTPQGDKADCTSPGTPVAPPVERKKLDRDMLISMVNSPDTYWRAKMLMDIEAHESICRQVESKNWQEAIRLAIAYQQARPMESETVFESAEKIHDFIKGKVGGAP